MVMVPPLPKKDQAHNGGGNNGISTSRKDGRSSPVKKSRDGDYPRPKPDEPGLKDYVHSTTELYNHQLMMVQQMSECIGKGAFGSVFKAFNWGTGKTVAIKQVKLGDLPKSELRVIMVCHTHPERSHAPWNADSTLPRPRLIF